MRKVEEHLIGTEFDFLLTPDQARAVADIAMAQDRDWIEAMSKGYEWFDDLPEEAKNWMIESVRALARMEQKWAMAVMIIESLLEVGETAHVLASEHDDQTRGVVLRMEGVAEGAPKAALLRRTQ